MLQLFGPDIWIADGPVVVAAAGFHYPTRMAVLRLGDGGLVVWSPVELSPALRAAVDALGPVRFLAPPNVLHDSFLAQWRDAYPEAAIFAPPGLRARRPDIGFAGDFASGAVVAWAGEIEHVVLRNALASEVVFFHRASGTAIFTDLLQRFPSGWFRGWRALVARLDLMVEREPSVPRKFRLAFTDKAATRVALEQILNWPVEKVLMAHGEPVTRDGAAFLRRAFDWLR